VLAAVFAGSLTTACRSDARSSPGPGPGAEAKAPPTGTVIFMPEGKPDARVRVRVVKTEAMRRRGLMLVRELPEDEGMLFLFAEEKPQVFWMRNTYLSLDMIFVRADLTVAGVTAHTRPLTDDGNGIDEPSQYVVEANAGWARRHGVRAGTRVKLENVALENIE